MSIYVNENEFYDYNRFDNFQEVVKSNLEVTTDLTTFKKLSNLIKGNHRFDNFQEVVKSNHILKINTLLSLLTCVNIRTLKITQIHKKILCYY